MNASQIIERNKYAAQGIMGCPGPTGPIGPIRLQGNVATVDAIYGNDATASVGGSSFLTVQAAVNAVSAGQCVYILPGKYNLSAGLILPDGITIRGINVAACTIQMLNVTSNTTLLTMGNTNRIEDLTLLLTSTGHYTLKGIVFGGITTTNTKLRTTVVTVDNSSASSSGTSTVTGIECNGTGILTTASFSFNSLKGSTINVYSNGGGNKRGVLVSNTNIVTTRDLNVYVSQPGGPTGPSGTYAGATGSYVGVETADPNNTGSIQMRSTTVGIVNGVTGANYIASDILQTNPSIITQPTYLASPGIQVGPGTDLVTKTAGGKGFTTYIYPTIIYYGLKGAITSASSGGYLWPGTQQISAGNFPDTTSPPAYFRIQQPSLLSGLSLATNTGPGSTHTVTLLVRYTPISTGILTSTSFTVTLTGTQTYGYFYNGSVALNAGDKLHLVITYTTGGPANAATDVTAQVDLF
jgi:hypothetical protein